MARIRVYEDNMGASAFAQNPSSLARTTQIDVGHQFLSEKVEIGAIYVLHVTTKQQHADVLTKPIGMGLFELHGKFCRISNCRLAFVCDG